MLSKYKKTNISPRTRKVANLWGITPEYSTCNVLLYLFIYLFPYCGHSGGKKKCFEDVPADETPLMRIVHNYRSPPAINNLLVCILHKQKQTQTIRGG